MGVVVFETWSKSQRIISLSCFFSFGFIRRCRFWAVGVLSQYLDAWSTWIYSYSPLWTTQRNYRRDKDFFHAWIKTLSFQCGKYAIINKIKCLAITVSWEMDLHLWVQRYRSCGAAVESLYSTQNKNDALLWFTQKHSGGPNPASKNSDFFFLSIFTLCASR